MRFLALTKNVIRELLHERVYLISLLLALFLVLFSLILGEMTFNEANKLIADFGLLAVFLILFFVSIFTGAWSIQKETEKQTLLLILARPVSRETFLISKVVGISLFNFIISILLSTVVYFLLKGELPSYLNSLQISLVLWSQSVAILGFAFLSAQVVRANLAAGLAVVITLLGYWLGDIEFMARKSEQPVLLMFSKVAHWVVPNFYRMNVKSWFAIQEGLTASVFLWSLVHCLVWACITTWIAAAIFRRKDLV